VVSDTQAPDAATRVADKVRVLILFLFAAGRIALVRY
jgi:hypothetical protein